MTATQLGLRPYPAYKDSALPWLGSIPAHWDDHRAKYFLREVDERSTTGTETLLSLRQLHGLVPHVDVSEKPITSAQLIGYKRTEPGDIVMNRMQAGNGMFARTPIPGLVSPDYAVLRPTDIFKVEYFVELFKTPLFRAIFRSESKGLGTGTSGFLRLYTDRFGQISMPMPPLSEQEQMLAFLRAADGGIGKLIQAKRRMIGLLNERKQEIVHRAVTRGLDPDVPLKPSGIPSIGDVPDHWEIKKLKQITRLLVSNVDKHTKDSEQAIRLCNYTDVYKNEVITNDMSFMVATASDEEIERFRIRIGDVIITKDSEMWNDIGVPALVAYESPDLVCGYHLAIFRPQVGQVSGAYLLRALQDPIIATQFHVQANGVTRYGLSQQALKDALVPVPPIGDQGKIVAEIDQRLMKVNGTIDRAQREIDLLREYRTRLIADVVTGKLDVRGIALPGDREINALDDPSLFADEADDPTEDEGAINADE